MSLAIKHTLPLDDNLISYLIAMTSSWTRKKLPIQKSDNGLAYWNGFFIGIPDFRYSLYSFVANYPLEQQFSFYSAVTFHESMHAKFGSHKADRSVLINNSLIPPNFRNFAYFIANIIEDGRIERLGLIKREGSVIHHQLYRFNLLISESNWKIHNAKIFDNESDKFISHLINQLQDLVLLGKKFLNTFLNIEEETIIYEMNKELKKVFGSFDPNSSIKATIKFFEWLQKIFSDQKGPNQNVHLPELPNHCRSETNQQNNNSSTEISFTNPNINLEGKKEFLDNPFSDFLSSEQSDDHDIERNDLELKDKKESTSGNQVLHDEDEKEKKEKKMSRRQKKTNLNNKRIPKNLKQLKLSSNSSTFLEQQAYNNFLSHYTRNVTTLSLKEEEFVEYVDTFGNNTIVERNETEFTYSSKTVNKESSDFYDIEEFITIYERLDLIAFKTAIYFLQQAGINIKKKDGVGDQKIVLTSQKDGKLQLSGNALSQLLAGNRYIYKKEMPAKIKISLDLIILVDLTGSMEFQVNCDGRTSSRIDFVNEATIILANTLKILDESYKLPINYSIIGYSAPDGETPVLDLIKDFSSINTGKDLAKAILNWYPNGENCDARAIFEATKLLENLHSTGTNKVIFFLSDGGGEAKDYLVEEKIIRENPKFQFRGPKDYSDVIRYTQMRGIQTYVFNLEHFQNFQNGLEVLSTFQKYYGEKVYLIENLNELTQIFTKCLMEIFKKR